MPRASSGVSPSLELVALPLRRVACRHLSNSFGHLCGWPLTLSKREAKEGHACGDLSVPKEAMARGRTGFDSTGTGLLTIRAPMVIVQPYDDNTSRQHALSLRPPYPAPAGLAIPVYNLGARLPSRDVISGYGRWTGWNVT